MCLVTPAAVALHIKHSLTDCLHDGLITIQLAAVVHDDHLYECGSERSLIKAWKRNLTDGFPNTTC